MRVTRLRYGAVLFALSAFALPAQAASASSAVNTPLQVSQGVVSAATLRLPASVAAVEGRVLVAPATADLVGVAPVRGGTALTPVAIPDGFAFGAYHLKPKNGAVTVRLVLLPNVTGNLQMRVLIDAAA